MKRLWMVLWLVAGVVWASSAWAEPVSWKLDTAHSGVYFEIQHIFSQMRGHFDDFSGEVTMDPKDLTKSRCRFVVKTKSINTFNRKRDTHLRSPELFHAKRYPEMVFESTRILRAGSNAYTMEGNLTVKGKTQPVRMPLIFHGVTPNPFKPSQKVAGFTTEFTIDRLAYGVGTGKYLELGVIGKDAKVKISVELIR